MHGMSIRLDNIINAACAAISQIRGDLAGADVHSLSPSLTVRDQSAKVKAWSYVWLAAVNERCVKDTIQALLTEINDSGVPKNKLLKNLFGVVFASDFQSLKTARHLRSWNHRATIFSTIDDPTAATMNINESVLDGRTIRGEHFECIWNVFGFPMPCLLSPRHKLALVDLAEGRNRVAHGHADPIVFGRGKAAPDLVRIADLLEESLIHLFYTADAYLTNSAFRLH